MHCSAFTRSALPPWTYVTSPDGVTATAASGGEEKVRCVRRSACQACRGTGAKDGTRIRRCASCRGTGRRTRESRRRERAGEVVVQKFTVCKDCEGRGEIVEEACPSCHGRGEVDREEFLTVNVPVGVEDGMALRVPGPTRS